MTNGGALGEPNEEEKGDAMDTTEDRRPEQPPSDEEWSADEDDVEEEPEDEESAEEGDNGDEEAGEEPAGDAGPSRVYLPGEAEEAEKTGDLVCDESAYELYHTCGTCKSKIVRWLIRKRYFEYREDGSFIASID